MEEISLATQRATEIVEITALVQDGVTRSGVREGVVLVYCPHTTAGILTNERADPAVAKDLLSFLSDLVPEERPWEHGEGNSPAHVKAALVGTSASVVIEAGRLCLGRWQGIFFAEFDGPRERQVWVRPLAIAP